MTRYARFILANRRMVLLVTALLTAAAVAMCSRAVLSTSMAELFFGESPQFVEYLERTRSFSSDETVVVGIEQRDVLAPENLDRLQGIVDRINAMGVAPTDLPDGSGEEEGAGAAEGLDDEFADFDDDFGEDGSAVTPRTAVGQVNSILSAQRVRSADGRLQISSWAQEAREAPERRGELLAQMTEDPLISGLLVSRDGEHTAVIVELTPDTARTSETEALLVEETVKSFVQAGYDRDAIHVVGFPAVISALLDETLFNLVRLFPAVAVLLLLAVWLLFRRLWPAFVSTGVAGIAVFWTMGMAIAVDPRITVMHTVAPVVVLIVSFSDVIHLVSAYLMELEDDKDKEQAIIDATTDVGRACWYTSVTTFTGFVSMSFVPTPVFRQLGVILGAGVAIALILAMTLVPIFLYYLPRPVSWRVGATSRTQGWIDGILDGLARWTTTRPWPVILGWCVVLVVAVVGLFHFHVETRFSERMDEDHQVNVDRRWFAEHFAQANYLSIFVEADERDALLDPELMLGVARLQEAVDQLPEVDNTQSVVDLLQLMHRELAGPDAPTSLPNTREGLSQYLLMFEMSGGRDLERVLDFDRRTALINVRLNSEAIRETYDTGVRITTMAEEYLGDRAVVKPTGAIFLTGEWLGEILAGQGRGLIFTVVVIALMMMIALRSVRVGLWSMVPNILPLVVFGGALGLIYGAVDSDTLLLAALAIGIGVDDTIHFMMRYRAESQRTDDTALALKRTYGFAGRAIVMTTLVLAVGFGPCLMSSYYSFWIMGSMLPFILVIALLADLLLVPAMVSAGLLNFTPEPEGATEPGDLP